MIPTSLISFADKAPGKSCLLAKTNKVAPANLCKHKTPNLVTNKLINDICKKVSCLAKLMSKYMSQICTK